MIELCFDVSDLEKFYIPECYKNKYYYNELSVLLSDLACGSIDDEHTVGLYHYCYGYIHALYTASQISRCEYDNLCYFIEIVSQLYMEGEE